MIDELLRMFDARRKVGGAGSPTSILHTSYSREQCAYESQSLQQGTSPSRLYSVFSKLGSEADCSCGSISIMVTAASAAFSNRRNLGLQRLRRTHKLSVRTV